MNGSLNYNFLIKVPSLLSDGRLGKDTNYSS